MIQRLSSYSRLGSFFYEVNYETTCTGVNYMECDSLLMHMVQVHTYVF
jgi:hypothetical protein